MRFLKKLFGKRKQRYGRVKCPYKVERPTATPEFVKTMRDTGTGFAPSEFKETISMDEENE